MILKKSLFPRSITSSTCSLSYKNVKGKIVTVEGRLIGRISHKIIGKKGFGYDPIFIPDGYSKTFGEMKPSHKMSIDHRFKAYIKMKKFFN